MSGYTIIILLVGGAISVCAGAAAWLVTRAVPEPTEATAPVSPDDTYRRRRAQDFLGGDPERPVRGGQEMKPRW